MVEGNVAIAGMTDSLGPGKVAKAQHSLSEYVKQTTNFFDDTAINYLSGAGNDQTAIQCPQ
jgi:hypothetical protein